MELRQLEYFVAVAEEANFTRAAGRVHISQSGVSAQIRQLERDLGAVLFDRSGRTATLTDAGRAALEPARSVLAGMEAVRGAVDDVTAVLRGSLTIGMPAACTITGLFDALAAFHRAHPTIEMTLVEDTSEHLVDGLMAGRIDLALVATAARAPVGLDHLTIISERIVAAVPFGHRLGTRHRVTLQDLAAEPIICMPSGTGIRAVFDQTCRAHGVRPTIALQASAPDSIADLAMRGLGVAILTESIARGYADHLRPLAIREATTAAVLAVSWATEPGPALAALVAHCRAAFGPATQGRSGNEERT